MPSLTVILSDWPMALRIVSAISTGGLLVVGRQVKVAFVNRSLLHVRREIVGVAEHPVGKLLVAFVVAGQDDELGAKFSRPRRRHRRIDAELPGLVGGRGDDAAAFAANGNGFAPQPRVGGLLNGREEGIRVEMDDGAAACQSFLGLSDERLEHALNHQLLRRDEIRILRILGPQIRLAAF